jgi:hypothetical protein
MSKFIARTFEHSDALRTGTVLGPFPSEKSSQLVCMLGCCSAEVVPSRLARLAGSSLRLFAFLRFKQSHVFGCDRPRWVFRSSPPPYTGAHFAGLGFTKVARALNYCFLRWSYRLRRPLPRLPPLQKPLARLGWWRERLTKRGRTNPLSTLRRRFAWLSVTRCCHPACCREVSALFRSCPLFYCSTEGDPTYFRRDPQKPRLFPK